MAARRQRRLGLRQHSDMTVDARVRARRRDVFRDARAYVSTYDTGNISRSLGVVADVIHDIELVESRPKLQRRRLRGGALGRDAEAGLDVVLRGDDRAADASRRGSRRLPASACRRSSAEPRRAARDADRRQRESVRRRAGKVADASTIRGEGVVPVPLKADAVRARKLDATRVHLGVGAHVPQNRCRDGGRRDGELDTALEQQLGGGSTSGTPRPSRSARRQAWRRRRHGPAAAAAEIARGHAADVAADMHSVANCDARCRWQPLAPPRSCPRRVQRVQLHAEYVKVLRRQPAHRAAAEEGQRRTLSGDLFLAPVV